MSLPGKLLLHLYHRPIGLVRESIRYGGPVGQWNTARGRAEMQQAAHVMRELPTFSPGPTLMVHMLTGRKYWYQTVFCLHSLARKAQSTVHAELYDDGTSDAEVQRVLRRLGPRVRVADPKQLEERLNDCLPRARFPTLRERWDGYPRIRRLIAAHVGRTDWKLVLDSDLLFFRNPYLLVRWSSHPEGAVHAVDRQESCGYSRELLEKLAGSALPERINAGVWSVRSETIDWEEIEAWCSELTANGDSRGNLERALVAMLMAREPNRIALPADEYVVLPGRDEVARPKAVMHHYSAESRRWYFQLGWKHAFP